MDSSHDPIIRARALLARDGRRIIGLAGPPGSGKSTLAERLAHALGEQTVVVPMDGFHLANEELARLGRSSRKGAPDTFDSAGYIALLRRLRAAVPGETVYAPRFNREIEEAIAGAIAVPPDVRLVITEGNYLLLDGSWAELRGLLDEAWYLQPDETQRKRRLLARHMQFGRTQEAALAWIEATDEPNAQLIATSRSRAGLIVNVGG